MKSPLGLWKYRNLIYNLAQRELRSRYKKSVLGWLWSLINPAAILGIYTLVFGTFLRQTAPKMGHGGDAIFALYLFAALVIWNYFNGIVTGAIGALQGAGPLLNKVYFPPACPAIAYSITVLLQCLIESTILIIMMVIFGNAGPTLIVVPFLLFFTTLFSLGLGLVLSVYNVYFRDVGHFVNIAMQLLFYGTPIIYSIQSLPDIQRYGIHLKFLLRINPLSELVEISQQVFYLQKWPNPTYATYVVISSTLIFIGGWILFERKAATVQEEL